MKTAIGTKKILIVDDEKNLLEILKAALMSEKVSVQIASTIEDAFKAVEADRYDVVIADICLTGIQGREGLELDRFIKEKSPGTYIMNMTGYGTEDMEKQCYESGADFYFNKPLDLHILIYHLSKQGITIQMMR